MPHLTIQHTTNLTIDNANDLLHSLNDSLWQSGEFKNADELKSRIIPLSDFLVGVNNEANEGFIYLHLKLMAGRNEQVKQRFAERLAEITKQYLQRTHNNQTIHTQICVEVADIAPCYYKLS